MRKKQSEWWMGQIVSALLAGAMWAQYSPALGLTAGFALLVLIDIRNDIREEQQP